MNLPQHFNKLVAAEMVPGFRLATRVVEAPLQPPGPNQILVRNRFMGINGSDPVSICGGYGITQVPFDLGLDSGGEVVAVGTQVSNIQVSDQVLMFGFGGGFGEYRLIDQGQAYVVPNLTAELMSAFIPALTAAVGFAETGALKSGETVMVTAAAGGVGSYAVQLAKLAGNHVLGTTGNDAKVDWLRTLGCDRVINYRREDLGAALSRDYPQGVDVVFETVGRETFDTALQHLAPFGRLLSIGATAEYGDGVNWQTVTDVRIYQTLLARSATIAASTLAMYPRDVWQRHLNEIVEHISEGRLQPTLDTTQFEGLDTVADAVEYMQAGHNTGKIIVHC